MQNPQAPLGFADLRGPRFSAGMEDQRILHFLGEKREQQLQAGLTMRSPRKTLLGTPEALPSASRTAADPTVPLSISWARGSQVILANRIGDDGKCF